MEKLWKEQFLIDIPDKELPFLIKKVIQMWKQRTNKQMGKQVNIWDYAQLMLKTTHHNL